MHVHDWMSGSLLPKVAAVWLHMHLADGCISVQQAPGGIRSPLPPPDVHKQHRP